MRKKFSRAASIALLATGTLSVGAYGQTAIAPGQVYMQPGPWPYGPIVPYWGYWYSPCYPFASCMAYQQFQTIERRQERWEELRRGLQPQAPAPTPSRAARAPANEADVRPEYKASGEYLPEFLEGRVRPGR
ncbi:MAG TPA: hypothetical protein VEK05_09180 [Burkholderiales bacterium]|nr:hypothetical protein [Burkholderiales bacterium]